MFILYIKDSIEEEDPSIEDFAITKINQVYGGNSFFTSLRELKEKLQDSDVYTPIEVMKYAKCSDKRQNVHRLIKNILQTGFHFIWKQQKEDSTAQERQTCLIHTLRQNSQSYYNRANRRSVKNCEATYRRIYHKNNVG